MPRTGRRTGDSGTREAILTAARAEFGRCGYDRATVRAVAAGAAVDPALVYHYFGSKEGLFVAAMQFPAEPSAVLGSVFAGDPAGAGHRLVRTLVGVWDETREANPLLGLLRTATASEQGAAMLREFVTARLLDRVAAQAAGPDARLRASLVGAQVVGIALMRYVVRLEPLASADPDRVADLVGPVVQGYLDGG